jgi:hypothetical protein
MTTEPSRREIKRQAAIKVELEHSPRFVRVDTAVARGPLGRSSLYDLAHKHQGLFRKAGNATIVDLDAYEKLLSALPQGPGLERAGPRKRRLRGLNPKTA